MFRGLFFNGIKVASTITLCAASMQTAYAAEGQVFGGPVGGTDMRNAYLPAPGLYMGAVAAAGYANHSYGDNGKATSATVGGNSYVGALGLMYVYPFKFLNGSVASAIQFPVQYGHFSLNGRSDYFRGFGDTYAEIISWSRNFGSIGNRSSTEAPLPPLPYGLTVKFSYSMIFPTGKYNTTQLLTPGHNVYFFIPNFAFSYLTMPNFLGEGIEISGHVFLDFASHNSATNYSTGPVGDFDYAVTQRMGRWQAGLAGYYANQFEDDIQNGQIVKPNGKKLFSFGLGPVVAYDIPSWKASVKLKVQLPVSQRNSLNTTRIFLSFNKAL